MARSRPVPIAALSRVEQVGATVVLVTGRPPRWINGVAEAVGNTGLAICANGALVYDLPTQRVLRSHLIDPGTIAEAVRRLRETEPEFAFAVHNETGLVFEESEHLGLWEAAEVFGGKRVNGAGLVDRSGSKLIAYHPGYLASALYDRVQNAVGDLVTVTYSSADLGMIEMSASGVSKASALAELCAETGVLSAEVVAFGDMPNDLPMLTWAGQPYAVANAHPDVLAAVGNHTRKNDDDGVARVLETLFPA
jgi:hydroxymethylpyrimidine pyrophosphatase-like HAD family hydrolase